MADLGFYSYKARMYSPTLGRFLQPDPIGHGDGMNMYAYVSNNPVNASDPSDTCATGSGSDIVICVTPWNSWWSGYPYDSYPYFSDCGFGGSWGSSGDPAETTVVITGKRIRTALNTFPMIASVQGTEIRGSYPAAPVGGGPQKQQAGRPDYCSSAIYKTLQMGVDLGSLAADVGGGMIALELLFGEPGLGGATVEGTGSLVAVLSSAGQAAMGDKNALTRVGHDILGRGALRLMPKSLRSDIGDFLFGKGLENALPGDGDSPC